MPPKSLGFEPGDILLVKGRPILVKRIFPNFDITYADLLNPAPGEDKRTQFCSLEGFEKLYRPEPSCYHFLRFPAALFRFQANTKNHYVELLKFEQPPPERKQYVIHEVIPTGQSTSTGRCWEYDKEIDALHTWRQVCSGHPPIGSQSDDWLCKGH